MSVTLDRHDSPLGTWTLAMWTPERGSDLAGLVEGVWDFQGTMKVLRERHFPLGTLDLVLHLGPVYGHVREDDAVEPFPRACFSGLLTGTDVVEAPSGPNAVLGFRLLSEGAFRLLRRPIHELTGHTVTLENLLGSCVDRLSDVCHSAGSPRQRVRVAVRWLLNRLGPAPDPEVEWAARRIRASHGVATITDLHESVGASRTRFTRTFTQQVGMTPKHYARIQRFRRALEMVAREPKRLVDVALDCGYYDQSHFTNDFKTLSGRTPGEYRRSYRFPESQSVAEPRT